MEAKTIKELVAFALADTANRNATFSISRLPRDQAAVIQQYVHADLTGAEREMDTYHIRHALREHGSVKGEAERGQVAITLDDFELVPDILRSPDTITYAGKNKRHQDIFIYKKRIGNLYFVAEAVRFARRGNKLVFSTLYKQK